MNKLAFLRHSRFEPEGPIKDYFYIEGISSAPLYFHIGSKAGGLVQSLEYSLNGKRWIGLNVSGSNKGVLIGTIHTGEKIYFRGIATAYAKGTSYDYACHFSSGSVGQTVNHRMKVGGNIMSLLYGSNFEDKYTVPNYAFANLFAAGINSAFYGSDWAVADISDLRMPATTLGEYCYYYMFQRSSIENIPENLLPAKVMKTGCYAGMFFRNDSVHINQLPANLLHATTLASSCYS